MESNTNLPIEEKSLSFGEKLKFFFIKPQKLFSQYIEKPKYLKNLIILAVITCITSGMSSIAAKDALDKLMEQQTKGLDPAAAEIAKNITNITTSPAVAVIMGLLGLVLLVYFSSAIYFGLTKLFKGEGTYSQMVATYVLAYYPVAIGGFISATYSLALNKPLLDTKGTGFGDAIIKAFNVFGLWRIVLFAIGISVVFKISKKKSAIIVIIVWAILLAFSLVSAGINQAMLNVVPVPAQ